VTTAHTARWRRTARNRCTRTRPRCGCVIEDSIVDGWSIDTTKREIGAVMAF
jgi:hypothetical protein